MSRYSMWGFGTFAIEGTNMGMLVVFSDSRCIVGFEKVADEKENLNHIVQEAVHGYRAFCDIDLQSLETRSYQDIIKLAQILDYGTYKIYPFYNSSIPLSKQFCLDHQYGMRETSDFSVRQMHKYFETGQTLQLSFEAKKLVDQRPTIHNDEDLLTIVGYSYSTYNRGIM